MIKTTRSKNGSADSANSANSANDSAKYSVATCIARKYARILINCLYYI